MILTKMYIDDTWYQLPLPIEVEDDVEFELAVKAIFSVLANYYGWVKAAASRELDKEYPHDNNLIE